MSAQNGDTVMQEEALDQEEELAFGEEKLRTLPGATATAVSFQIEKEDHTLGNALRYFINKNPDVEFCGYAIPHPSETKLNIRIQTFEDTGTTAYEALAKGLDDLMDACDVVTEKFSEARDEHDGRHR